MRSIQRLVLIITLAHPLVSAASTASDSAVANSSSGLRCAYTAVTVCGNQGSSSTESISAVSYEIAVDEKAAIDSIQKRLAKQDFGDCFNFAADVKCAPVSLESFE